VTYISRKAVGIPAARTEGAAVELRTGQRLHCEVCASSVVVVRSAGGAVALECDGRPLGTAAPSPAGGAPAGDGGTLMGKRYTDDDGALELLCVRGGAGTLVADGRPLRLKEARALPSSD